MLALAIVLLALVAALVVASFVGSSEEVVLEFLNVSITTSAGGVFVVGFVAGLVTLASLYLIRTSLRRSQKRRKELSELRRQAALAAPTTPEPGELDDHRRADDTDLEAGRRDESEAITRGPGETSGEPTGPSADTGELPGRSDPADAGPPPRPDSPRS